MTEKLEPTKEYAQRYADEGAGYERGKQETLNIIEMYFAFCMLNKKVPSWKKKEKINFPARTNDK